MWRNLFCFTILKPNSMRGDYVITQVYKDTKDAGGQDTHHLHSEVAPAQKVLASLAPSNGVVNVLSLLSLSLSHKCCLPLIPSLSLFNYLIV